MSNVLIRDVPPDDLEPIRSAPAERGASLQNYLQEVLHAQAVYLRRQDALAKTAQRLAGKSAVPGHERRAVLDTVDADHEQRAEELSDRRSR